MIILGKNAKFNNEFKEPLVRQVDFKLRLTAQERIAIRNAAKSDDNVFDFLDLVNSADPIDTASPQVDAGIDYLISIGILDAERKADIL